MKNEPRALRYNRRFLTSLLIAHCSLLIAGVAFAKHKAKLPPSALGGEEVFDLAPPTSLQAMAQGHNISLFWKWKLPELPPEFVTFGFDVLRDKTVIAVVGKTGFVDVDVPLGRHIYNVRARGGTMTNSKKIAHFSDWSDPAETEVTLPCSQAPTIDLKVETNKQKVHDTRALQLHLSGQIRLPANCHLSNVTYHVDSGMGSDKTSPLPVNSQNRFDDSVDALAPEDEYFSGARAFVVTVTAKDEEGSSTSNPFTIELQQENPFAPKIEPSAPNQNQR